MPEYDAFGREIGEDTLAGWRQPETEAERDDAEPTVERAGSPFGDAAPATDSPVPITPAASPFGDAAPATDSPVPITPAASPFGRAAPPSDAPPPVTAGDPVVTAEGTAVTVGEPIVIRTGESPPAEGERVIRVGMPPGRRPVRRRPRVVSRLILLLVVVGLGGTLVVNAGRDIEDAIRDVPGLVPPVSEGEAAVPVGLQAGSLIRPGELRRALAQLRSRQLGRTQTMRLAPERIDAAFVSSRGVLQSVQLRHDGGFQEFSSTRNLGHLETIPWARLNPAAPARLVRQAAQRMNRPVSRIDYLVPSLIDGKVIWGAYFKGGQIFQGDARGRLFRRIS